MTQEFAGSASLHRAVPVYYTDDYHLHLGNHVFPSEKYTLIYRNLLQNGHFRPEDFLPPPEATDEQLLRVHTRDYVRKVRTGHFTFQDILRLEMNFSEELAHACLLSAGGTIEACYRALEQRVAVNLGGGFHHAHADHGEGFCVLNDIAVGIAACLSEERCHSAMVVDCDVHQGNGTAAIFMGNPRVFTLSLHQEHNYPMPKAKSSLDVGIRDGAGDEEYLLLLDSALNEAFHRFQPELLIYVAGADLYEQDQLGGLSLTLNGIRRRDETVLSRAAAENCATAITLAGGYARDVNDTVTIHVNTILAAQRQHEKMVCAVK